MELDWPTIAAIIYTTAWSVSFYGQVYDNYKLKNVQGFSLNYLVFNINGYLFYGIYTTLGYFTSIKGAGTVVLADLIFVYHALLLVGVQTYQCVIYPKGRNSISKYTFIICFVLWIFVIINIFITVYLKILDYGEYWNPLSLLGYCKIFLSFIKYSPAVYWNYKRKSTKGWSIFNIILDLVGGSFSIASGGLSVQNGLNVSKMALAILTIAYDIIFVFQHYCLYRNPKPPNQQKQVQQYKKVQSVSKDDSSP